jgi:hypothetical protein
VRSCISDHIARIGAYAFGVVALFVIASAPEPANAEAVKPEPAPLENSWANAGPVNIIFDTDMGNDVDDVMALAMIHALETRGAVKLLAVTVTKDHDLAAPFVDALNTFYCRPDIPIGAVRGGMAPGPGKFLSLLNERDSDLKPVFPHDLKSGRDAPDAIPLLRRLLAESPDKSVALVQVGFFTNFRRLLETGPDRFSPLSGRELIMRKVAVLSVMGGAFETVRDSNVYSEYNVRLDIESARIVARDWPTKVIWTGYETGIAVPYPAHSIEADFTRWSRHLLREAYILYQPWPHNRSTWDLISVLAVVYGQRDYFGLSKPGAITIADDGFTGFQTADGENDQFVKISTEQAVRLKELMVNLVTQPPPRMGCK